MNGKMVGDLLREARLAKQLQLTDIEKLTGIESQYLLAMELDQFGLLPSGSVDAYLTSFAEVVGLDSDILRDQYEKQSSFQNSLPHFSSPKKEEVVPTSYEEADFQEERTVHRRRRSHREETQKKSVLPVVILSLLSIAIVATVAYITINHWPFSNAAKNNNSEVTTTTTTSTSVETTTVTEASVNLKPELQADGSYLLSFKATKENATVMFSIKEGESWVASNDGVNGELGSMLNLDQKEYSNIVHKGGSSYITIGLPKLVTLTVDGHKVDLSELHNQSPAIFTLKVE